jgi:hypothetical protein
MTSLQVGAVCLAFLASGCIVESYPRPRPQYAPYAPYATAAAPQGAHVTVNVNVTVNGATAAPETRTPAPPPPPPPSLPPVDPPGPPQPVPVPAPEVIQIRPKAKGIDAKEAKQALKNAELETCKERGLRKGYGHVHVTFDPRGFVSRADVDLPRDLPRDALVCVGERLGGVTVAPFEGSPVIMGASWLVP